MYEIASRECPTFDNPWQRYRARDRKLQVISGTHGEISEELHISNTI
jgi:hypothetical protein